MRIRQLRYAIVLWPMIAIWLMIAGAGCGSVDLESNEVTEPAPSLSPAAVVSAQLRALSRSGEGEDGIEIAYRFISPSNRETIGSLEEFRALFDDTLYGPMLGHRDAEVFAATVEGDLAMVPVRLIDDEGEEVDYLFVLIRQREEPYKRMWMIDAVQIHSPDDPDTKMR